MTNTEKIQQIRTELQAIDQKLLSVLERRVKKSIKIQRVKERENVPLVDVNQERAKCNFAIKNTSLKAEKELVDVFKSIIELSKKEYELQKKNQDN